jgi:hypothetical protein
MLSVFNGQVLAYPGNAVPFVSSRSIMLRGLVIAGNDGLSFPEGPQRERWPGDASNLFASTN